MHRTAVLTLAALAVAGLSAPAHDTVPTKYQNCTNYHHYYPHGVGKTTAKDHTSGTPVTNFRKDNAEFARAMKYNAGLDRDKDNIACEKR